MVFKVLDQHLSTAQTAAALEVATLDRGLLAVLLVALVAILEQQQQESQVKVTTAEHQTAATLALVAAVQVRSAVTELERLAALEEQQALTRMTG